jgi:hypothetical protein
MALFPSPRIRLHKVFVRDRAETTTLTIYEDGAAVVPTAATFRLEDDAGKDIVATTAATVSGGGELSYIVPASALPTSQDLSDGWLITWVATIAGVDYTFRRPAALARSRLYPVISDVDLEAYYSDLASIRPSSMASFQGYITEAFITIVQRLRDEGNFEYLIMDPQTLRAPHLDLTFYLIWKDMDSSGLGEGRYLQLAQEHRRSYESGFKRLKFRYDLDQDGEMDDSNSRRAAMATIYTSAPPAWWNTRRW